MGEQDINPNSQMQEMLARMAQMQAELNELKQRSNLQPPSEGKSQSQSATTRRKALSRIGGGLVAAGLGSSLPLLATSAASFQETTTSSEGEAAQKNSPVPSLASDGSLTQTFVGHDFKPNISGSPYTSGEYGGISWTGPGGNSFFLHLYLPQSVKITNITFFYRDNGANRMFLGFYRFDPSTHTTLDFASSYTPSASAADRTLVFTGTPSSPLGTIDNSLFCYMLNCGFTSTSGQILWGAKVSYVNILGQFRAQ